MYNKAFDCRHVPGPRIISCIESTNHPHFDFPKDVRSRPKCLDKKSKRYVASLCSSIFYYAYNDSIFRNYVLDLWEYSSIILSRQLRSQSRRRSLRAFSEDPRQPVEEREHDGNEMSPSPARGSRENPKRATIFPLEIFPAALSPFPLHPNRTYSNSLSRNPNTKAQNNLPLLAVICHLCFTFAFCQSPPPNLDANAFLVPSPSARSAWRLFNIKNQFKSPLIAIITY